jgi:hypothetical protein
MTAGFCTALRMLPQAENFAPRRKRLDKRLGSGKIDIERSGAARNSTSQDGLFSVPASLGIRKVIQRGFFLRLHMEDFPCGDSIFKATGALAA